MAKNTVTVRLPEELLEAIKAEAQSNKSTVSQVLIDAILIGRKSTDVSVSQPVEEPANTQSSELQASEQAAQPESLQSSSAQLEDLTARVYSLECFLTGSNFALGQLMLTATRSAAAGQFYSRLATEFLNDISTYLITNQVLDTEERKRRSYEMKQKCREFQQQVLNETYEQFQNAPESPELQHDSPATAPASPKEEEATRNDSSSDSKAA